MARITVEDCLDKVDNRFQLVMIASKRARQLQIEGKEPLVPADKDKPTVIALREIAEGFVNVSILNEKPSADLHKRNAEEEARRAAAIEMEQELIPENTEEDSETAAPPVDLEPEDE